MTTLVGLKNPEWDLSRGKFDEIDKLPLMSTPGPVLMILAAYLLFVLKIGPAFMRKREAFQLRKTLILYNLAQVLISLYLVIRYSSYVTQGGIVHTKCIINDKKYTLHIGTDIWLYFLAKITEFLDTIFFVLRKKDKQITFLHLYHHSIMMIGTWAFLKYEASDHVLLIGLLNSGIHVLMYTYYGLAAIGPQVSRYLTWKKYMTSLQLVQFVIMIVHYIVMTCVSECPPSKGLFVFIVFNIIFFIYLFSNFYKTSYTNGQAKLNASSVSNGFTKETKVQ